MSDCGNTASGDYRDLSISTCTQNFSNTHFHYFPSSIHDPYFHPHHNIDRPFWVPWGRGTQEGDTVISVHTASGHSPEPSPWWPTLLVIVRSAGYRITGNRSDFISERVFMQWRITERFPFIHLLSFWYRNFYYLLCPNLDKTNCLCTRLLLLYFILDYNKGL